MNPSTALATVCVDELLRCGVRDVVVCPGSRSGPLALAFVDAAEDHDLTSMSVPMSEALDFLALGLAKVSGSAGGGSDDLGNRGGEFVASHRRGVVRRRSGGRADGRPTSRAARSWRQPDDRSTGNLWRFRPPVCRTRPHGRTRWERTLTSFDDLSRCRAGKGSFERAAWARSRERRVARPAGPRRDARLARVARGAPRPEAWTTFAPAAATTGAVTVSLPARTLVVVGDCPHSRRAARRPAGRGTRLATGQRAERQRRVRP